MKHTKNTFEPKPATEVLLDENLNPENQRRMFCLVREGHCARGLFAAAQVSWVRQPTQFKTGTSELRSKKSNQAKSISTPPHPVRTNLTLLCTTSLHPNQTLLAQHNPCGLHPIQPEANTFQHNTARAVTCFSGCRAPATPTLSLILMGQQGAAPPEKVSGLVGKFPDHVPGT